MPVIVALVIRSIIQMAVTLGLVELASRTLLPMLNSAIAAVSRAFGASDEQAQDIVANEFLQFAEQVGVGVLVLRAKLPTTISERLGFTSKGWGKRPIKPTLQDSVTMKLKSGETINLLTGQLVATDATAILTKAKTVMPGASTALKFLEGRLNSLFLGALVFANFIDFGNWTTGAYSDTFQKIFEKISFGLLVPNEDYRKTKTASPEVFDKVYNTYKIEGAVAINDNFKQQTVVFSRDALIDIVDKIGAGLLHHTGTASTKDVLLASQLMIVFKVPTTTTAPAVTTQSSQTPPKLQTPESSPTLFVGQINQGQLSAVTPFTPQIRERITNADELTDAVTDNVAAFLSALPGMVIVNVKLKDSVSTPDGTQLIGTLGKVQTSVSKTGKPHYRRFRNSFVVAEISILKNTGGKTTIGELVAGPLDESMIDPAPEQLVALGNALSRKMITTDLENIDGIQFVPASAGPSGLPGESVAPQVTAPVSTPIQTPPTISTPVRVESLNAWEVIAIQKQTRANYLLPDGTRIRAAIGAASAPTVNLENEILK